MDLDDANETDKAVWKKMTDYVKDYKLDTYVTPDELWKLADRIDKDSSLASVYKWNMTRNVAMPVPISQDDAGKIACMLKTSNTDEEDRCNGVKAKLLDNPAEALFNFLEGTWVKEATSYLQ